MGLARGEPSAPPPRIGVIGDISNKLKFRIMAQMVDCECELFWGDRIGLALDPEEPLDGMIVVGGKAAKGMVAGEWLMRELAGCFVELPGKKGRWVLVLPLNPDDEILERVRWLT